MSGIRMIPPPTPISPLTTPPASPIPISTRTGARCSVVVAAALSIGGVYGPHRGRRPQPLAGCRLAWQLRSVYEQCTIVPMSPQPRSRMSPPRQPLPLAAPSPGDAWSRLLSPAKTADAVPPQAICRRAALAPSHLREKAGVRVAAAPCTQAPGTSNPAQAPSSGRQSPPKSAPPQPKSFLEKTLTRATPPHFALQTPPA